MKDSLALYQSLVPSSCAGLRGSSATSADTALALLEPSGHLTENDNIERMITSQDRILQMDGDYKAQLAVS